MDNNYNDPFYGDNQNQNNSNQGYNGGYSNRGSNNTTPYSNQNTVFMKRVLPISLAVLLLVVGFLLGFFIKDFTLSKEEQLAKWLFETIDSDYLYGSLTDTQKEYVLGNMGKGAIYSLDQFSDFLTPSEVLENDANQDGEYVGIGFSYGQAEDANGKTFVYISQVYGNSDDNKPTPANKVGLQKYDRFFSLTYYKNSAGNYVSKETLGAVKQPTVYFEKEVEYPNGDEFTEYSSLSDVYYAFYNIPADITFDFEIKRLNTQTLNYEKVAFTIKKETYKPVFVKYQDKTDISSLDDKTAVITLMSFNGEKIGNEIANAMETFESNNMENLILDLRDNGGGLLKTMREIASYFVRDNKNRSNPLVAYALNKNGVRIGKYEAIGNNYNSSIKKIIVLINGNTASASESLLGAMIDYGTVYKIVGTNSYGKGVQQGFYYNEKLGYGIYLTNGYMYWPVSGKCIDKTVANPKGIQPDEDIADAYFEFGIDNQLEKAITLI